ncbi:MAG: glycosyltransferase family 2 protein [Paludibacter sp.]
MKVLAVIVTYNGLKWYDSCFSSLRASNIPVDIFVIDNASSDDTLGYIKTNFPQIILIESPINLGFGQANNKGMRYALENGYDFVFLLNQDAWIEPNTIEVLVSLSSKNIDYGILSPMHLVASKDKFENEFSNFIIPPYSTKDFLNNLYVQPLNDIYPTQFVNAAAWLISMNCLETIGGFDPIFFHYEEDMNFTHRVIYHGFQIGFCPGVTICHDCENRVIEQKHIDRTYFNRLITDFVNINNKNAIKELNKLILTRFIKIGKLLLFCKITQVPEVIRLLRFLIRNKSSIIRSRESNSKKGAHYIS